MATSQYYFLCFYLCFGSAQSVIFFFYQSHEGWTREAGIILTINPEAQRTFIGSSVMPHTFLPYFRIFINQFLLYKALIKLLYQLVLEAWHLLFIRTLCQKIARLLVNTTPQGLRLRHEGGRNMADIHYLRQVAVVTTHTGMLPGRAGQADCLGDSKVQI